MKILLLVIFRLRVIIIISQYEYVEYISVH